jgi:pSer/pThr/pTyr-binding forkhead associated (FHA) protein
MITCKICNNEEYQGVLFCGECGSQLAFIADTKVTTLVYPNQIRGKEIDFTQTIPKKLLEERTFILYSTELERVIDIPDQEEFTIGRFVEGQVITPDVDLNLYDAYDMGISRLHATIRINKRLIKAHVIDLGSANGSSVNGYEIPANSEVPLNHGDILTLGKFNMKVILPQHMK